MKFILIVTEEASEKTRYFGPFNSGEEASQTLSRDLPKATNDEY